MVREDIGKRFYELGRGGERMGGKQMGASVGGFLTEGPCMPMRIVIRGIEKGAEGALRIREKVKVLGPVKIKVGVSETKGGRCLARRTV